MRAGSFFTGIGGFDLALIHAGFEIAWQSEIDEQASALLARRFPGQNTQVSTPDLPSLRSGTQNYGVAGTLPAHSKKHGHASEDGTGRGTPLVVAGAVSSKWAKGTGWPAGDEAYNLTVVPLLEVGARTNGDGYRDGDGIGEEGDPMYSLESSKVHGIAFQQNSRDEVRQIAGDAAIAGAVAAEPGAKQQNYVAFAERTRKDGRTFEASEDVAFALQNPGSGGTTHSSRLAGPVGVRRLTPTECERLQGFPDGWTEGQSDSARYRQLGNAVSIPPVEWIMKRIKAIDDFYSASVA